MMDRYDLHQLSEKVGKAPSAVHKWFQELYNRTNQTILIEDGQKIFDANDLMIAQYIADKREEGWAFSEIFHKVEELFDLDSKFQDDLNPSLKKNPELQLIPDEDSVVGIGRDPESLFYEIAQDNEIIRMFKFHSLRVMFLASKLAKSVGCYDEDLRIAAMLHDIGKMGLSKHILLKPGKLNDLEYSIVQSHSHIGNVIVRKHLGLTRAARFIRDHHERWDGTGYPRRLLGDEISIQGRIISICDAFDTMTYDQRNYQKDTLSFDEAFDELKSCSWSQFDGNLVTTFLNIRKEINIPEFMIHEV